jgi:hypothetical protein
MCIVIDANVWSPVFNENDANHREYAPVKTWVSDGPGFVVYGGSR